MKSQVPTTESAKRIANLFHRKLETPWSEREIKQFKKLVKAGCFRDLDDLRLIECYYIFERKKKDGVHRRDVLTLLNNFQGELDRAREWHRRNGSGKKEPRKVESLLLEESGDTNKLRADFLGQLAEWKKKVKV